MKNYYEKLGLKEDASLEDIKKAFRVYASKYHPDKHSGDKFFQDRFLEVKEAYDHLIVEKNKPQVAEQNQDQSEVTYTKSSTNTTSTSHFQNKPKVNGFVAFLLWIIAMFLAISVAAFMGENVGGLAAVISFFAIVIGFIYLVRSFN